MEVDIKALQDKIKENPNDYKTIEEYAIALSDIGHNEEALKNFIYLRKNFPENAQEKLKRYDDAVKAYEKAININPDDTDIMYNLAYAYIKIKKYDEAEKLLLEVIKKDTEDNNSYFHLGEIYSRKKEHDNAIKYLSKALELDNNDTIALFYLAYEYSEINNIDKAIELYNKVIELNQDYSWAYYNLASIYVKNGDDMPLNGDVHYLFSQVYKLLNSHVNYLKYLKLTERKISTFTGDSEKLKQEIKEAENKN